MHPNTAVKLSKALRVAASELEDTPLNGLAYIDAYGVAEKIGRALKSITITEGDGFVLAIGETLYLIRHIEGYKCTACDTFYLRGEEPDGQKCNDDCDLELMAVAPYACPACEELYDDLDDLMAHVRESHQEAK